jgi:hypothetical protein
MRLSSRKELTINMMENSNGIQLLQQGKVVEKTAN